MLKVFFCQFKTEFVFVWLSTSVGDLHHGGEFPPLPAVLNTNPARSFFQCYVSELGGFVCRRVRPVTVPQAEFNAAVQKQKDCDCWRSRRVSRRASREPYHCASFSGVHMNHMLDASTETRQEFDLQEALPSPHVTSLLSFLWRQRDSARSCKMT